MSHPDNKNLATAFVARSGGIVESGVFHQWLAFTSDGDVTIHALRLTRTPLALVYCVLRASTRVGGMPIRITARADCGLISTVSG